VVRAENGTLAGVLEGKKNTPQARAVIGIPVRDAQFAFFERVREHGLANATNIDTWRKPYPQNWYEVRIGDPRGQILLQVNSQTKRVATQFWIRDDKDLYAKLLAQRGAIEADLGFGLEWDGRPDRKASKLTISLAGDFQDETQSQELVEWLVATGDAFAGVLSKYLGTAEGSLEILMPQVHPQELANAKSAPVRQDLTEITQSSAVARAVEEFRALGRDAFLKRHGQHPSSRYFADVDGLHIDSKPLLSVAYGYQYPDRGPLAVRDFSGGAETRRALRRFGYELVEVPAPPAGSAIYYGEVPECPAGTVFKDRREAYDAGVHRTTQAAIAGQADGTQSICLSDGYSDDKVQGDLITYTGFGGRDANTGRLIADQKLEKGNLGLVENYKLGRPVRVLVKESVLTGKRSDTAYLYLGLFTVAGWSWGERDDYKVLIYQLRAVAGDSLVPGEVADALVRGEDLPTQRRSSSVNRIVRNFDVAASVKRLYDNTCQICGTRLLTAAGPYSEGAHIRPLGVPHNGPDTLENILCLCPNCHALFDGHALTVHPDGTVLRLGESIGELTVAAEHRLNFEHLAYQLEISRAKSSHANTPTTARRT
jgi:putative restriction endonuclease